MKIFSKKKKQNGRRVIYLCGQKVFSYKRKQKEQPLPQIQTYMPHPEYGKIYFPLYNAGVPIRNFTPDIYNAWGRKMDVFFIRDIHTAHNPYSEQSQYFLWDRYNIGLDTHFYTHATVKETMGNPKRKFAMFIEPPSITPQDYEIFINNPELAREFDGIFTFDSKLLDRLPNAKFYPVAAKIWYGHPFYGGKPEETGYMKKTKNVSIIASNKKITEFHLLRQAFARKCKELNLADTFGRFEGGSGVFFKDISDPLEKYRYHIVIENGQFDYYFSEKIINCFASHTIPIYLGARKIHEFFNPDGIIVIDKADLDRLEDVLKQCTPAEYERRLPAVIDNYNRVFQFKNMENWLYEHYFLKK